MEKKSYILSVDQSTQRTKCLLLDAQGTVVFYQDIQHRQILDRNGWVTHDPEEIYKNLRSVVCSVIANAGVDPAVVRCVGISNQRETSVVWEKENGRPVCGAIVWQCARAAALCRRVEATGIGPVVQAHTGIPISPYFPAAKYAWVLENVPGTRELADAHRLCFGTIDTWLLYRLTDGACYRTDYSNASRTQLFDISRLCWDAEICRAFGIDPADLPEVCDSDATFGMTDFGGLLPQPVPICGVIGDSQGALLGHGGVLPATVKATYGTGSSVVMNIGGRPACSTNGLVTSIAWRRGGELQYIMEGNINYSGAVVNWLRDIGVISAFSETQALAEQADADDSTYLVPAFSGLGAPYWSSGAKAAICGMTRRSGKAEIVRAGLESIAYQIHDIVRCMEQDFGADVRVLLADGGAAKNEYLMQFQSDILNAEVHAAAYKELSGLGAAYLAGVSAGVLDPKTLCTTAHTAFRPEMQPAVRQKKLAGWHAAVEDVLRQRTAGDPQEKE